MKEYRGLLVKTIEMMENYWLAKSKFIMSDEATIADISCACEL